MMFYPILGYSIHFVQLADFLILIYPILGYSIQFDQLVDFLMMFYPILGYSIHFVQLIMSFDHYSKKIPRKYKETTYGESSIMNISKIVNKHD